MKQLKKNISILPDHLCSGHSDHDIRIGYGGFRNNKPDQAIPKIGDIIKKMDKAKPDF